MKEKRDLIFLLGLSLILVTLWVTFSVYHNLNASTIDQPVAVDINPIEGSFNEEVITTLKKRQKISPLYTVETQPEATSQSSSPSASPQAQTSTQSAKTNP